MRARLRNVVFLAGILFFIPLMWITAFVGPDLSHEEFLEKRVVELRDRLHFTELQNREWESDVRLLKNQVRLLLQSTVNGSKYLLSSSASRLLANFSLDSTDILPPSMFHYLPHLAGHTDGLKPSLKLSQGRSGVSMVLGIPTIKRDRTSYLPQTLRSLIDGLNQEERDDCIIIVFVAEPWDMAFVKSTAAEIQKLHGEDLKSGLIEVIAPPAVFYPDLNSLRPTFGDSLERVKWRTKQNLDYSFLMMYAERRGTYYVQLEDDVVTKPGYLSIMKNFALNQKTDDWLLLEYSHLGFIGKLFKTSDLPQVVEFLLMFHKDKPIDWLLDHLFTVKVCNPEKDSKHCARMISEIRRRFKPSLFQHIGVQSSLKGKVQKLKDKDFGKAPLHRAHVNPPAEVSTTLKVYQRNTIERAYLGETFFWGLIPSPNDQIRIKFSPPIKIEKFYFKSGNAEHPGDKFYNTTVELLPLRSVANQQGLLSNHLSTVKYRHTLDNYLLITNFDHATGEATADVDSSVGEVEILRIRMLTSSQSWVILSEIHIKPVT